MSRPHSRRVEWSLLPGTHMLARVAVLAATLLVGQSSAFLAVPIRYGIKQNSDATAVRGEAILLHMGKRKQVKEKKHNKKQQQQQQQRLDVVGERGQAGSAPTNGAEEGGGGGERGEVPRLVVMDLDDTLWHPELDQMRGSPFTKKKDGKVRDRAGTVIDLFPGVREALLEVHKGDRFRGTKLAIASRTSHERWAKEVMGLIELEPGLLMRSVVSFSEIYTGSKVRHFGAIRRNSGVPYEDMIFFDDWNQNCKDVGSLGVTCIECRRGLNWNVWTRGLDNYAAAKESLRP